MGVKGKRKNIKIGDSIGITFPATLTVGEYSTFAGNRLLLIDPKAELSEDELLSFMEKHIEPTFWTWRLGEKKDWGISEYERTMINTIPRYWHSLMLSKLVLLLKDRNIPFSIEKRFYLTKQGRHSSRYTPDCVIDYNGKTIVIEVGVPINSIEEYFEKDKKVKGIILLHRDTDFNFKKIKTLQNRFSERIKIINYLDFQAFISALDEMLKVEEEEKGNVKGENI